MPTSLDSYAPFDSGAGASVTEDMWRNMMRQAMPGDGVIWYEGNEFEVFADSTGMQVKVRDGKCWIEGHWGYSTAQKTLAIASAHATLARIDSVVLRADFVNNGIVLDVKTGTPAASPVAPSLTQGTTVWEIRLANVAVAAAAVTIAAGSVTDKRQYTGQWSLRPMGHAGRTNGFQSLSSTEGSVVLMESAQFTRGCTFADATDSLRIDRRGRYRVSGQFYYTNGSAYLAEGWVCKNFNTDNLHPPYANSLVHDITRKGDGSDYTGCGTATVDLEKGDLLRVYIDATSTWGTDGYNGTFMEIEYAGQSAD